MQTGRGTQLPGQKIQFTRADRVPLAALLRRLPRAMLRQIRLLIDPDTVLHWHRDLIAAQAEHDGHVWAGFDSPDRS
jgi:hypothetical protein